MPAYNAELYVGEAIESILNQSFQDFEFIVCDDCSTDTTWKIIKEYASKDKRIISVKNKKNLGIAGNRNKLVAMAKGEYIVWQDADDISMPFRLECQYQFMEQNPEIGISGGWLHFFNEKGELSIRKYPADDKSLRAIIFKYSPIPQPAAIIRTKSLKDVGEYDLTCPPAEDLDMSFRIGEKYKFGNLSRVLIKYRESGTSATFAQLSTMELNTLKIRRKYASRHNYSMTISDKIYNLFHYLSIFIVPPKLKIKLFMLLRNSK